MNACTRHEPNEALQPHRHREAYVALVLDGGYDEMSIDGRFACRPGSVVVHPPWHAHADDFGAAGAVVMNLPAGHVDSFRAATVADADAIIRLAERCPNAAGRAAIEEAEVTAPVAPAAWLTQLVALLADDRGGDIGCIAARCGVSPEHASRACKRWFGVGPSELRREGRLRHAMRLLKSGATPVEAAIESGFCDQPHLTRLLKRATGLTPSAFVPG